MFSVPVFFRPFLISFLMWVLPLTDLLNDALGRRHVSGTNPFRRSQLGLESVRLKSTEGHEAEDTADSETRKKGNKEEGIR